MMWTLVIVALALAAMGMGAVLWLRARAGAGHGGIGFQEYVRDPRLRFEVARSMAQRGATATRLAGEPPAQLVRMLLDNQAVSVAIPAIRQAGPEIVPHLVAAVDDPAFREPISKETQESMHLLLRRSAAIISVLQCLQHYVPESAVKPIAALVNHDDDEVRKEAALLLGMIASDETITALCTSLRDEDDFVRNYAMMGILRALDADRGSSEFRNALFDAILPLVWRRDKTVSGDAPKCLLRLDRTRAAGLLASEEALSANREGLQDVLRALREARVAVDAAPLLGLAETLERGNLSYPDDYVLGETLQLLAASDSDNARAAIQRGLKSPSRKVKEDAARAMALSTGLTDPYGVAFRHLDQHGWDSLTESQRQVLAVRILIDEVDNGGFAQYFVNSSGNRWPDALAGLKVIGATKEAELAQQAIDLFGPRGPSLDDDQRHRQLAKIAQNNDTLFSSIEDTFYKDEMDREVLLLQYIIAHDADFRDDRETTLLSDDETEVNT